MSGQLCKTSNTTIGIIIIIIIITCKSVSWSMSVLHFGVFLSALQKFLKRTCVYMRVCVCVKLANAYFSINELDYLIESLAIDFNY